jgi:LCP family protein required for cell wall assembly
MHERPRARFPALGAALSFFLPGLGQLYAEQPGLAALFAVPVLVLIAASAFAALALADQLRNAVLSSSFLIGILALDAILLVWRLASILLVGLSRPVGVESRSSAPMQALGAARLTPAPAAVPGMGIPPARVAAPPGSDGTMPRRWWEVAIVVVLVAATLAMHAWTGYLITRVDSTLGQVFGIGSPGSNRGPVNRPNYHWNGTSRINFLLLGVDSDPTRSEALTDTILVVSVDPVKRSATMVSIPRDTGFMPLPDRRVFASGVYPDKINSLTTVANRNPKLWCPDLPDPATCGIRTLERTVGLYLGIDINYYATVNLSGFSHLIDALGGVRICVPGVLTDPTYSGPTWAPKYGITLQPGCQQMDGPHALAYSRIRKGTLTLPNGRVETQNDFKRADRQQEVLLALRAQFAASNWVFTLPSVLQAVGETVATDFPRDEAGNLASLLPLITDSKVKRVVLAYPQFVDPPVNPTINYLLIPKRDAIRREAKALFGADGPLQGWYVGSTDPVPPRTST